jgi:hypothetical protein
MVWHAYYLSISISLSLSWAIAKRESVWMVTPSVFSRSITRDDFTRRFLGAGEEETMNF